MSAQLSMFALLLTSEATPSATSSPALAVGLMPSGWPDGPATANAGLPAFPANPIQARGSGAVPPMNEISGQFSFAWSSNADPQSSSESKSLPPMLSGALLNRTRTCRTCSTAKPSSEFYVNSKGSRRRVCKDCEREAERKRKRANPDLTHDRHRKWRRDYRGHALVNVAKHRAKSKGIPFDLSPLDIQRRIDAGHCELTGIAFDLDEPRAWNAPSLDRRKPGAGYTRDNVRVVLHALNTMANVWGENRIVEIANAITARRVERSNDLSRAIGDRLKARIDLNGSPEFEMTWTEVVTPSGHVLPRLVASARRTSGKDFSGLEHWPTPRPGKQWGTIQSLDAAPNEIKRRGTSGMLSATVHLAGWPTPTGKDQTAGSEDGKTASTGMNLRTVAGWTTPRANKWGEPDSHGKTAFGSPASTARRGALSPLFSLWLMLGSVSAVCAWASCAPAGKRARRASAC